mgnify:CR=1 FL=1
MDEKQKLLEIDSLQVRTQKILSILTKELQMLELKNQIQSKVKTDLDKQQRDYILNQQLRTIQEELGDVPSDTEIADLEQKAKKKKWSKEVGEIFSKEIKKLKRMNHQAAEFSIQLNYLETMIELPWNVFTKDHLDIAKAEKILNQDHYGMEKVKERILEYLAVIQLKGDLKSPILCLYGPPGVGKTSLGKSIAEAIGRKYVRMSLGGLHDESEIRGHRKTYIGAMPGKLISNLKKVGTSNPVFVLDEIDKVGRSGHGDPSSALLEVLDPEQNDTFQDNFVEIEYDLSKVLFIATANDLSTIQPALRDRMEIIPINGYTIEEKVQIAKKHLIPKQITEHGLTSKDLKFNQKAIEKVINDYTRESGVRSLERKIAALVRNIAKSKAMETPFKSKMDSQQVRSILGSEIFDKETYEHNDFPGIVTGLAWTPAGGDILFIESSLSRGKGKLTLSGQLGDVMKESAVTALSYLKSNAEALDIHYKIFDHYDLHVHVPAGAIPKDGPSAGITMLTALASLFTQRKVKAKIAMTGEITLRGKVLPVGGVKEKILAAKRAGIKEIVLSLKNKKDIDQIDDRYLKLLQIHYVENVNEVLNVALLEQKVKQPLKFIIPK